MIAVVFFDDGDPSIVESKHAISFKTETMVAENVTRIVFSKNKTDAQAAIEIFGSEWKKK